MDEEKKIPEEEIAEEKPEEKKPEEGMDEAEFGEFVEELKKQGATEEDILDVLYEAFTNNELDLEDLKKAAGFMGYELDEDFEKEIENVPEEGGKEVSEEQIEAAKEAKPGESEAEFKERVAEGESVEESEEEDDEDEERREAMKLFE